MVNVPEKYQRQIRYICAKANDEDETITAAAAQLMSADQKTLISYGVIEPVKITAKATTTVFKVNTTHPNVRLWWKRYRKERK